MSDALEALRRAPSDFAVTPDDIWDENARPHVPGINEAAMRAVEAQIDLAERSPRSSVYGLPLLGEGGRGKSHLLGQARVHVQSRGGFFVRLNLLHLDQFWSNLAGSFIYALNREHQLAPSGLAHLLESLAVRAKVPAEVRQRILVDRRPDADATSRFIAAVRELDPSMAGTRKTLRALIDLHSQEEEISERGEDFFAYRSEESKSTPEVSHGNRKPPKEVVRDLSQLMALCGATVIAVDQVDDIVRASNSSTSEKHRHGAGQLLELLGVSLVDVRDETRRSTVILACLENTWMEFSNLATATIAQRFEKPVRLDDTLPSKEIAAALLAAVLKPVYDAASFTPPYQSYPFRLSCLADAVHFSPRKLLLDAGIHLRNCVAAGVITEPENLGSNPTEPEPVQRKLETAPSRTAPDDLDRKFDQYRAEADLDEDGPHDPEYHRLRPYLIAGLRAYRAETGRAPDVFEVMPSAGEKQSFHVEARDRGGDRTQRWVFRAIANTQGTAVRNRVRALYEWAKLGEDNPVEEDHGVLWVAAPWSKWRKWSPGTQVWNWVEKFEGEGIVVVASEEDLRVFAALHRMESERVPGYEDWLRKTRPASRTNLLQAVFGAPHSDPAATVAPEPTDPSEPTDPLPGTVRPTDDSGAEPKFMDFPLSTATATASAKGGTLNVGALGSGATSSVGSIGEAGNGQVVIDQATDGHILHANPIEDLVLDYPAVEDHASTALSPPAESSVPIASGLDGTPVHSDLAALANHTGVFAGSGSGKTVLLRRIIETAALQGVSSIVLDPNNDLSRLGERWPYGSDKWLDGDSEAASAYFDNVEVVVWTPGRSSGRPLSFQPLPDFSAVTGDHDEFGIAVRTAVDSLAPRAGIKAAPKDVHARAVLVEALSFYARDGSSDFPAFLDFLEELPDLASSIPNAQDIAAKIASTLRAVKVIDPVFAGQGETLDPGVLLTPSPGRRARISVVNFIGLPSDEQRHGFINQLELALFSWVKRNPAVGRPLSGLLVLDEAQSIAPSIGSTVCRDSTLALASQARKYGLGMLFATQAPKGIHNQIVNNCGTHWYGRINSPTQIAAANEVAQNKSGTPVDFAHLDRGEFYLAANGRATQRVNVPMCLSHHPPTAPTAEEILAAVRRSAEEPVA
ncbi:ATP-binding protein [Glycomyces sp. NRRL B-16210]|uniref:ATP-binding protein n=1 Tax=Glycomyces sp. NRRL B-16210 TaxID=1463821 RepID=UPI00068F996A|nr:DUF87 domain-containing protein [Glycomyces sp. NRRL B-16210]